MPDVNRRAPGKTHTQSIVFSKDEWTKAASRKWLKDHDDFTDGLDETDESYRWRQYDPESKRFRYRIKEIKDNGKPISLVVGFLKSSAETREGDLMKQGIFMREMAADSTDTVIDIVGVIGWEVWYDKMRELLRSIPEKTERVIFEIYSPGGDVWEGNAIVQAIGELKQETVARVQVAASMATLIAVACDKREIAANGRWLIHNPWSAFVGDADGFEKRARELRDVESEAVKFYASRTGTAQQKVKELMAEERWLTPKEAQELGFVETINDPFEAQDFEAIKAEIEAAGKWPKALAEIPDDKGVKDADPNTSGAEGDGDQMADESDSATDAQKSEDYKKGYADGIVDGKVEADTSHAQSVAIAAEKIQALETERDKLDEIQKQMQGDRDKARAANEKLDASLKDVTAKLERLVSGGMKFTPAVDTWADALKNCKGNYEEARKRHPEIYAEQRAQDKANRR